LTVNPIGGFQGTVNLSCNQLPDHTQCAFLDGTAVSLNSGAKMVRLSINTSDLYGYGNQVSRSNTPHDRARLNGRWLAAILFPVLSVAGRLGRRRHNWNVIWKAGTALTVFLILLAMQACSGKLPAKTAPGVYKFLLRGTTPATNLQHTTSVQLTVTP